jgi:hypothetical protein
MRQWGQREEPQGHAQISGPTVRGCRITVALNADGKNARQRGALNGKVQIVAESLHDVLDQLDQALQRVSCEREDVLRFRIP